MSHASFSPEGKVSADATMARGQAIHIEVLDGEALRACIPAWEELAAHALEPNPYYEHWLLLPAIEAYGADASLLVAAVWERDSLIGLFPFERIRRYKGLPVRTLALWKHRHILRGVPLVRAGRSAQCVEGLLGWLKSGPERASVVELEYVVAGGAFHCALLSAAAKLGIPAVAHHAYSRGLLRKGADADAYIAAAVPTGERKELRRKQRRLDERGRAAYSCLEPHGDGPRWIEEFLRLEASGWKGQAGSALASSAAGRRFGEAMLGEAFRRGRLFMVGLEVDGRAIALSCAILAGAGGLAVKSAYDEGWAQVSPGYLLELYRIRRFHALAGTDWIDSFTLPGNSRLERLWIDRMAVEDVTLALDTRGEALVAAAPFFSYVKRRLRALDATARRQRKAAS